MPKPSQWRKPSKRRWRCVDAHRCDSLLLTLIDATRVNGALSFGVVVCRPLSAPLAAKGESACHPVAGANGLIGWVDRLWLLVVRRVCVYVRYGRLDQVRLSLVGWPEWKKRGECVWQLATE